MRHFEYYNEQDKKTCKYVEEVILNSDLTKYKREKYEFFKNHQYIFTFLDEREVNVLLTYYSDDKKRYAEIAKEYGISRQRINQILSAIFEKLRRPIRFSMLTHFDDNSIGFNGDNRNKLINQKLDAIYNFAVNNNKQERLSNLSNDERVADLLLSKILTSNQRMLNLYSVYNGMVPNHIYYGNLETILATPREDLKKLGDLSVINKIHSIGLHFFWEYEYEEDWINSCYQDMIRVGLDNIKQYFHFNFDNLEFVKLLNTPTTSLNLSIRALGCLERNNITTLGQLVRLTEVECMKLRSLGVTVFNEIKEYLNSLGLSMCPQGIEVKEWIQILSRNDYSGTLQLFDTADFYKTVKEHPVLNRQPNNKFYDLMATNIEDLKFTLRLYNCLKRTGINTIKDLVVRSEQQIKKIRNLGEHSYCALIETIDSLGLEMRPDNIDEEEWLKILRQRYMYQSNDKDLITQDDGLSPFEQLMQTPLNHLEFSPIVYTVLEQQGFKTVQDIVEESDFSLWHKLCSGGKGTYILQEVEEKVFSLGLRFNPNNTKGDWLKLLKQEFEQTLNSQTNDGIRANKQQTLIQKMAQPHIKSELILNKILSNINIGSIIDEMENTKKQTIKNRDRLFKQAMLKTICQSNGACTVESKGGVYFNQLSDKQILKIVDTNIEYIIQLDEGFINRYASELMNIVSNNRKVNISTKLELIEFINGIQHKSCNFDY